MMGNDLPHKHARVVFCICLVIGVLPIPNPANKTYAVFRRYAYLKYFSFCTKLEKNITADCHKHKNKHYILLTASTSIKY